MTAIMNLPYYCLRLVTKRAYRIRGIGLGRVCEAVRRYAARYASIEPLLIDDFRGDAKFMCYLREHMGSQIFFRGSYSGDQLTLIEKLLNVNGVFIDVGANQGEFSIAAARIASHGTVMAFEPVVEYRQRLQENVRLNGFENVQINSCALGCNEGYFPMYDQQGVFDDGTKNEGLSSLFACGARSEALGMVHVRKLDDVLDELGIVRVDVIKFDIEGAEWIALRGALKTIARCRPTLILEIGAVTCRAAGYEPQEFAEWVIGLGYRIEKVVENGRTFPITPLELVDFQNLVAYPA